MIRRIFKVKNEEQFINKLGSNRTLLLTNDTYDLTNIIMKYDKNIYFQNVYDGRELILQNIKNLKIVGKRDNPVSILVQPRYATVLNFINSKNITLKNLKIGHAPEEG